MFVNEQPRIFLYGTLPLLVAFTPTMGCFEPLHRLISLGVTDILFYIIDLYIFIQNNIVKASLQYQSLLACTLLVINDVKFFMGGGMLG